jgi:hypothetical protein
LQEYRQFLDLFEVEYDERYIFREPEWWSLLSPASAAWQDSYFRWYYVDGRAITFMEWSRAFSHPIIPYARPPIEIFISNH